MEDETATHDEPGTQSLDNVPCINRRDLIKGGISIPALIALSELAFVSDAVAADFNVPVNFVVNGQSYGMSLDPRSSLLDMLRESLSLTGAKKGCDHGQCGACTVHLDGRRVVSCLTPAVQLEGRQVLTIEGLSPVGGDLHPMQQAFIDHDALQCGYCTPGQIVAAVACVREGNASSADEIREYMSGNLCRCGAYVGIVAAIQDAASKMEDL